MPFFFFCCHPWENNKDWDRVLPFFQDGQSAFAVCWFESSIGCPLQTNLQTNTSILRCGFLSFFSTCSDLLSLNVCTKWTIGFYQHGQVFTVNARVTWIMCYHKTLHLTVTSTQCSLNRGIDWYHKINTRFSPVMYTVCFNQYFTKTKTARCKIHQLYKRYDNNFMIITFLDVLLWESLPSFISKVCSALLSSVCHWVCNGALQLSFSE